MMLIAIYEKFLGNQGNNNLMFDDNELMDDNRCTIFTLSADWQMKFPSADEAWRMVQARYENSSGCLQYPIQRKFRLNVIIFFLILYQSIPRFVKDH